MVQRLRPQAETLYGLPQPIQTGLLPIIIAKRDPTSSDTGYGLGQQWVNKVNGNNWFLGAVSAGVATWTAISGGSGAVNTINSLAPTGGNIIIAGTANEIDVTNGGSTVTLSLDNALIAPGTLTVTSGLTVSGGGASITGGLSTDTLSVSGNFSIGTNPGDVVTIGNLTSAAISLLNGTSTLQLGGNSTGTINLGQVNGSSNVTMNIGATNTGVLSLTIGGGTGGDTISIGNGANTSAQIINIANGASASNTTLNVMSGTGSAGAGVIHIGNNQRVTTLDLCNVAPSAARTITIAGGNQAQNDTVAILNGNPSGNTQTFNLMSGTATGGTQNVNIANSIGGSLTVKIGGGANSTAQSVQIANGNSAANSTVQILSGTGTGGAGVLQLGNNQRVTTVDIANVAPIAARTVTVSGGNAAVNDTYSILNGAPSAGVQTYNLMGGTATGGTQAVNIGNGIGGALTVSIGNGANSTAQTVNLCNGASAANTTLNVMSGSGTLGAGVINFGNNPRLTTISMANVAPAAARTVTICSGATAQNDTLNLMTDTGSAGTQTVNIMSGAATGGTQVVNVMTGASTGNTATLNLGNASAVVTTVVGSSSTTSTTTVQGGTGGLKLTGGQVLPITDKATADSGYVIVGTDQVIATDSTAGIMTIKLPAAPATGRFLTILDATGQAGAFNVTIDGNGKNISAGGTSAATKDLTSAFQSINLWYNGTIWNGQLIT